MPYKDPDKQRAAHARAASRWQTKNRAKMNAYQKTYCARHPERVRDASARYRQNNPARVAVSQQRYRQHNTDKIYAKNHRQRARRIAAPVNDFTAQQWVAMKEAYSYRCVYCGKRQQRLTQDHLVPLSKGGSHTYSNIVPACRRCNSKKGAGAVLTPVQPLLLIA